jgi:hypothetical protein
MGKRHNNYRKMSGSNDHGGSSSSSAAAGSSWTQAGNEGTATAGCGTGRESNFDRLAARQDEELTHDLLLDGAQKPALTHIRASVRPGKVRADHGLTIRFAGTPSRPDSIGFVWPQYLDIYGDFVFDAVPMGLGLIAKSFFPLKLQASRVTNSDHCYEFTLGAKQLSRARIDEVLDALVGLGDKVFVFEIKGSDYETIGYLPTKASLIKASLLRGTQNEQGETVQQEGNVRHYEQLLKYKKKSNGLIWVWIQWWKLAVISCLIIWLVYLFPHNDFYRNSLPKLFNKVYYANSTQKLLNLLPVCPETLGQAFALGQLKHQLTEVMKVAASNSTAVTSILEEAAAVVGRSANTVTTQLLLNVALEIEKVEKNVSLITRVRGFFTFVNLMWLAATAGITVSVGPVIYLALKPLRGMFLRFSKWFFYNVVVPFVSKCHYYGVFEVLAYTFCLYFVVDGQRMDSTSGLFVSLTGGLLLGLCLAYSTFLWALNRLPRGETFVTSKPMRFVYSAWLAACYAPLALHFNSVLFGYVTVVCVFVGLGFSVFVGRLCIFLGFQDSKDLGRVNVASAVLLAMYIAFHVATAAMYHTNLTVQSSSHPVDANMFSTGIEKAHHYLHPFKSAISVFGSNMYFLCMLIQCESYGNDKLKYNVMMCVSLVVVGFCGLLLGLHSLVNVAITYFVLWVLMRYAFFHMEAHWNKWVLVLIFSCIFWKVSLYLHGHPEFVVSLFTL